MNAPTLLPANDTGPILRYLSLKQVMEMTSLGKSYIYDNIKKGNFPAQINLGPNLARWLEHEVQDWMRQQVEASRAS